MAVGDIWYAKVNCSTNNRGWSFGLWCEEQTPITPANEGRVLSDALLALFTIPLANILSAEGFFESVQAWRRNPLPARPGYSLLDGAVGTRPIQAMPNDNAIFVAIRQSAQDAKFNGAIYVAGQSDADSDGNKWETAYLAAQVKTFTDLLPIAFNAVGGDTGQFRIGVVSKAFSPPSTPIGTFFDCVEAVAGDRVMTQRRRAQKNRGYALFFG